MILWRGGITLPAQELTVRQHTVRRIISTSLIMTVLPVDMILMSSSLVVASA